MTLDDLLLLGQRELGALMDSGKRIEPADLADTAFRGVSLGQPPLVDRLLWKKFKKVFISEGDAVTGFNQAVEANALDEPWIDRDRRGKPLRYGYYSVRTAGSSDPPRWEGHTLIDYGRIRDPLVSLSGGIDLLIGVSYLALGQRGLVLPSYFSLQPEPS